MRPYRSSRSIEERIVLGAKVPASVELEAAPAEWGPFVTKYRYIYSGDRWWIQALELLFTKSTKWLV
jgi:hypothetical protein